MLMSLSARHLAHAHAVKEEKKEEEERFDNDDDNDDYGKKERGTKKGWTMMVMITTLIWSRIMGRRKKSVSNLFKQ